MADKANDFMFFSVSREQSLCTFASAKSERQGHTALYEDAYSRFGQGAAIPVTSLLSAKLKNLFQLQF